MCLCVTKAFNNCSLCFECVCATKATALCADRYSATEGAVCAMYDSVIMKCFKDPTVRDSGLVCMECDRLGADCCGALFASIHHLYYHTWVALNNIVMFDCLWSM